MGASKAILGLAIPQRDGLDNSPMTGSINLIDRDQFWHRAMRWAAPQMAPQAFSGVNILPWAAGTDSGVSRSLGHPHQSRSVP
jgi:hypothetical protein